MFAKLLKYEFKNSSKLFGILSICALAASIVGSLFLSVFINVIENEPESAGMMVGGIAAMMLWFAIIFSIVAYLIALSLIMLFRFYKSLFTDEGYLTFTLPVTTHQLLLSKILHIAVWSLISILVFFVGLVILILPFFAVMEGTPTPEYGIAFQILADELGSGYVFSQIYLIIASAIYNLIVPLLAITIGSLLAKRLKVLASFGIYYGLTAALSITQNVINIAMMLGTSSLTETNPALYSILISAIPGTLYLAIGIGGYFIMHRLLTKKLNLA